MMNPVVHPNGVAMRHALPFSLFVVVALGAAADQAVAQTAADGRSATPPQPRTSPDASAPPPQTLSAPSMSPLVLTPGAVGPTSDGLLFRPPQFLPSPALPSERRSLDPPMPIAPPPVPRANETEAVRPAAPGPSQPCR